ncbi:hypothetical protein VNO77_01532 [Canavalia gladiata]|uniref:Uncharacterized protein n=1 Tax=Canavalia gladiata TaxID=3824 RepID=A0AAN9R5B7_CANGL
MVVIVLWSKVFHIFVKHRLMSLSYLLSLSVCHENGGVSFTTFPLMSWWLEAGVVEMELVRIGITFETVFLCTSLRLCDRSSVRIDE